MGTINLVISSVGAATTLSTDPMNPTSLPAGSGDVTVNGTATTSVGQISTLERIEGCFDPPKAITGGSAASWNYVIAGSNLPPGGPAFTIWVEARDNDTANPGWATTMVFVKRLASVHV